LFHINHFLRHFFPYKVLFYRDFYQYTGGHQKVFDYFEHFNHHPSIKASISFSKQTQWDNNPWFPEFQQKQVLFQPQKYDLLFLAGMDWSILEPGRENEQTVINLIQHVRHANPEHPLYQFLSRRAIRIAVSEQVAQAVRATGQVNGPVYTIENGHNLPDLTRLNNKGYDIYILGTKNPSLAAELAADLKARDYRVLCTENFIPREQVFTHLCHAHIGLLLPNPSEAEGFFLPALEAMKYCDVTIVPDCIGNRSFCFSGENCLMPAYQHQDLIQACIQGMAIIKQKSIHQRMLKNAHDTVVQHSIENERKQFYNLLEELNLS